MDRKAIRPFTFVDADDSTFVIDIDKIEKPFNSDHATQATGPAIAKDDILHPLLDGFAKPRPQLVAHDEYVIDKLLR